jgi:hypothetical protein
MITKRSVMFSTFALAAVISAAIIWLGLPHDREVKSLGIFLFKLVPFICATEAIAWLDPAWLRRPQLRAAVVVLTFSVYFLYFIPRLFYYSDNFNTFYYYVLTMTPVLIVSLTLAFRLGGGSGALSRRVGYASLLVMLSGLEDLSYLTTTPQTGGVPAVWTLASHMTVFVGHPLTRTEAFIFIGIHVVLALAVLTVPASWFHRRSQTDATTAPAADTPAETPTPVAS